MKKELFAGLIISLLFTTISLPGLSQQAQNWTDDQLMEPAQLAGDIQAKKELPLILNVGPAPTIPHSTDIGSTSDKDALKKLKKTLAGLPKDKKIVVYCGCCPFEHCPNVRPAIGLLKELGFTNYFLLNLPHNIKTDWIDKGYPTASI